MNRFNLVFYYILSVFLLTKCSTPKIGSEPLKTKVPDTFQPNSNDTAKIHMVKWRTILIDSSLTTHIETALNNNFDLRSALQRVQILKAGLYHAKAIQMPDLSLNLASGVRKFGEYTMDGVGNYDTRFSPNLSSNQQIPNPLPDYYAGFQTSWEIDFWGKLKNKKKAAADRFMASQYGKDFIVTNLIKEVALAYFELVALDNESSMLQENIALQESALELVKAKKSVGMANELGVELMKTQLINSQVILAEVNQRIIETESQLNFICGAYPSRVKRSTSYFSEHVQHFMTIGVPSDLMRNRPDIRQSEHELKASNADLKSAQAAFFPSININSAMGLQSFNSALLLETPASLAYNLIGGLTAPIFNRRKLKAELMASKAEQNQAYNNYEKTVVNAFREVYNAVNKINNTQKMYELKKEEVEILKKSIVTATELFAVGRANYLEVITAQKNALQAQIELINCYRNYNYSFIELYISIGGGWQ